MSDMICSFQTENNAKFLLRYPLIFRFFFPTVGVTASSSEVQVSPCLLCHELGQFVKQKITETIFVCSENSETFYIAMLCSIYTPIHRKRQGVIFPSTISRQISLLRKYKLIKNRPLLFSRAINWIAENKDCTLLAVDRHVLAGTTTFGVREGTDYLERNCVVGEPRRLCIYDRVKGKILKTVDSVYQAIDRYDFT